jgi:precorrin-2/cobalt-factor-2 C20-methyltransferase
VSGRHASGRLIGIGVGPGDPELMTLKATRALAEADLLVHFAKTGSMSHARTIAAGHIKADTPELPLFYPMTSEQPRNGSCYREAMREFYDDAAATLAAELDAGRAVAVICEGDPLFYGSYMHLHVRLAPRYPTQVIAGVTGMSGCWSAVGAPIAQGDDVFMVLPATLPEAELEQRLKDADAAVVMKLGRHLPKIRRTLARIGRLERAIYVERGSTQSAVMMRLADKPDDAAPYFAIVLVPGWEERA